MMSSASQETRLIGKYQLLERLAVGGMAEIFVARDRGQHEFERLVVVKKMLPHLSEDQSFVKMFLHEARVAAHVHHTNVVQILELGEDNGRHYIAMEYIEGASLRDLIKVADKERFHIPLPIVCHLMDQALAGAHAVHEARDEDGVSLGLVHRDLTPHNLMVTPHGHVKLLDFGVVKSTDGERTKTGVLKGKLSYMSPEQCRQDELDARSDVYSLGICLWELLAGVRMLQGKTELAVMQAVLEGDLPRLEDVRADVPERIHMVLRKALAHDRNDRYATAEEMRRDLHKASTSELVYSDPDLSREFITDLLGPRIEQRRADIKRLLETSPDDLPGRLPDPSHPSVSSHASLTYNTDVTNVARLGAASAAGALVATVGAVMFVGAGLLLAGALLYSSGALDDILPVVDTYVAPSGEPVVVDFAPTIDADILHADLEPFRRYLETEIDRPVLFTVADSYVNASDALLEGKVPFASLPPYIYLQTQQQSSDVELMAVKVYAGSTSTTGVLLVNEASDAVRAEELKGSTICYTDRDSTTGYLLPRSWLREQGIDPDVDFTPHWSGNHLQVVRDVVDGTCMLGGVYGGAFTTADQAGINTARTRVLAVTGRTPHDAIVAGPGAPPELRKAMQAALLGFDSQEDLGLEMVGEVERLTTFLPPETELYERLQRAVEEEATHRSSE